MMVNRQVPRNKRDPIYRFASRSFSGEDFLLHADLLLHHSYKYSYREIAQYLALASYRPIADYYATGKLTLDYMYVDTVDKDLIDTNRLLDIDEDGAIHFLYEEATTEIIH